MATTKPRKKSQPQPPAENIFAGADADVLHLYLAAGGLESRGYRDIESGLGADASFNVPLAQVLRASLGAYVRRDLAALRRIAGPAVQYVEQLERERDAMVDVSEFIPGTIECTRDAFPRKGARKGAGLSESLATLLHTLQYWLASGADADTLARALAPGLTGNVAMFPVVQELRRRRVPETAHDDFVRRLTPRLSKRLASAALSRDPDPNVARRKSRDLVERMLVEALMCAGFSRGVSENLLKGATV